MGMIFGKAAEVPGDYLGPVLSFYQHGLAAAVLAMRTASENIKAGNATKQGERALAEKLRWPLRSFRKVWKELAAEDMAQADWGAGVVCLPKAIDHDLPQSPNVIRAWGTWYREVL